MGLSENDLNVIKEKFEQKYLFTVPYSEYVNSCGISELRLILNTQRNVNLKDGESLDNLCLSVTFRKTPPKDLEFPSEYNGVKVFYEVVGEIRPLQ